MPQAKALFHFSDFRGECVIVKYFRDPLREISSFGMPRKNCGRNAFQQRQEILESPRRTGDNPSIVREPESLFHEQLHVEILCLVSNVRREAREQLKLQALSARFPHAR